jgi:ABC-2 type transport system ATP-binding protein
MPSATMIQASGLGRRFAGRDVVKDISFSLAAGESVGIVGPDGAGKTTLLQMLAALVRPSFGDCTVLGEDVRRHPARVQSRVGYMSQGFSLYDRLTVLENLEFAAAIRNVPREEFEGRKRDLLRMAALERFEGRREGALSGGMRKKLALCANLIHQPPLLILDEPSLGVDPLSRRELWNMLDASRLQGRSIVFATSYMDEADASDRVLLLRDGKTLALGTPAELRSLARGKVYQVQTRDAGLLERRLAETSHIISFQKLTSQQYRVQCSAREGPALPEATAIAPAEPSMEDIFTVASGEGQSLPAAPRSQPLQGPRKVLVSADGVTRRFGSFVAVNDVTLRIQAGEVLGLLGPNGAGKTTLMRMLCGLLPPTSGQASVAEFDVARQSHEVRSRIGYVSQKFSLFPDLTADENIRFFARAYGVSRRAMGDRIDWAFTRAGVPRGLEGLVAALSGAVRQRLALACAIVHEPQVLFLDEPTSGVDPLSRFRFWRLIAALAADGVAVIVSTHYLEEATYCDRLGMMMDGRMIALDTLPALKTQLGLEEGRVEDVFLELIRRQRALDMAA